MNARRHGWQRPLHPLQMVGMGVYGLLVTAFYCFLGLSLGSRAAEITVTTCFSIVALSVMFLFARCTATDPSDKTRLRKKRKSKSKGCSKLNYGFMFCQIIERSFRQMESKILKTFIRRNYLNPLITNVQMEPLLPFPLVSRDDAMSADPNIDDVSYCSICDFEVKKHSKHCRTCNRCVEGFDHHCRWLNNCVGKKNYTTFILLMIAVLLMLLIEGGTAIAIFVRCFADKKGIERELARKLYMEFPREVLAAISVLLVLVTAYGSAALGQLFFFHVILIRKGMRTYDYILAMKEENELQLVDDSDFSSDESVESESPKKPIFMSKYMCEGNRRNQNPGTRSIKVEPEFETSSALHKNQGYHTSIDPWKLLKMSKDKALRAAEQAKEKLMKQKLVSDHDSLNPLPFETRSGPLINPEKNLTSQGLSLTLLTSKGKPPGSPGRLSSPRRRVSGSPTSAMFSNIVGLPNQRYRNNFDLKLTEVSSELETYISKQLLYSVLKDGAVPSPS